MLGDGRTSLICEKVVAHRSSQGDKTMPLVIDNLPEAIRSTKRTLRAALSDYKQVFEQVEGAIRQQIDAIHRDRAQGRDAIPVFDYSSVLSGAVDQVTIASIKTRGACVVRGVFDRQ